MTTATLEKKSTDSINEQSVKAIDKPDDTGKIIARLFDYMAGEASAPNSFWLLLSG